MTDDKILAQAIEFANNIKSITDIKCPRGVSNPGLFLGYMTAAKRFQEREKEWEEAIRFANERADKLQDELLEMMKWDY